MRKLSGVAVPSCSWGSSHRGAMAVCQASVIAPLGVALAVVAPSAGNCASIAAPPANMSLLVSAIERADLQLSYPMASSLFDPRCFSGGHYGLSLAKRGAGMTKPAPER